MKIIRILAVVLVGILALTACSLTTSTDDTSEDASAVQSFFPNLTTAGYNISESDTVIDAITTALTGAAVGTGNLPAAALIQKVDNMIACYQAVGAADARIYTERINITNPAIPIAGVLMIVNENRIVDNFLHCLSRIPGGDLFESQRATPEPCWGYGSFTFNEERISYLFAATDQPLCTLFTNNFAPYSPEGESSPIFNPNSTGTGDVNNP